MEKKPCQCPCHKMKNNCNNHNHHHHHSKKHFHIRKTFFSRLYLILFATSFILLIILTIINIIFLVRKVFLPRIFFPGVVMYIASFICSGGALGSYGPVNHSEPQLMKMRKISSFIMSIVCIIVCPIILYQNTNLYASIKGAKIFCEENNEKSRGDIYSELVDEKENIYSQRNNFDYKYKNGLTCFERRKCLKSISSSKLFICNYNYEEIFKNAKCNKIFETEQLTGTFDNANMAYFVSSCMDLKKEKVKSDIEIFKCMSENNLGKEDSINDDDKIEIEKYYKTKNQKYDKKIADIQQKLDNFDEDIYFYDESCYSDSAFFFYFALIIIYILVNLFLVITWVILGITNLLKYIGLMEDSEWKYYQEKREQMETMYQQVHLSKEKNNQNDETTPINIK